MNDLLAGHVDMMFDSPASSLQHVSRGALKPIAVTSEHRMPEFPSVPTFVELGYPEMQVFTFLMVAAPKGTPQTIVTGMNKAVNEEMAGTKGRPALTPPGRISPPLSPEEIAAFLDQERAKWGPILLKLKIGE
jgi:tripartite-type tricarboxylate transporter receptor subunit TctC